jgi:DNA-binding IclR family transcriptional regulator
MKFDPSIDEAPKEGEAKARGGAAGSQTLVRGLEIMEAVRAGKSTLPELADALGIAKPTLYRLAATLVDHRYLSFTPRVGYALGPKLLELGFEAGRQMSLPRIAHPHLAALAEGTGDTVHLGVLDGARALYLDKLPGRRRVDISSRVGERQPLRSTGLGKALILDEDEGRWRELYQFEEQSGGRYGVDLSTWLRRMNDYAAQGNAFDLEENEDRIRCVAAPLRDVSGKIVGAISVSSAAQYMDDARLHTVADDVRATAQAISRDLGWTERSLLPHPRPHPKAASSG